MESFIQLRRARSTTAFACALSLAIGAAFVFVRSPLPWGWEGIDRYHQRALSIVHGNGFPTMDVPAGYALFLAAFYRAFGDHPVIPLCAQVALNAVVPWIMFRLVAMLVDVRTAALTALLVGVFSFNTLYASTQAADAVGNVLFVAGVLALASGSQRGRPAWIGAAALLLGLASQFRPNLILFPPVAAAWLAWSGKASGRGLRDAVVMVLVAATVCVPWTIRNYRLTGEIVPASTHAGMQLWYGTLQVGTYRSSRVYSPRALFETPPWTYSSISDRPIVIAVRKAACARTVPRQLTLVFWTDRQRVPSRVAALGQQEGTWTFELPGQPSPTAVYYYLEAPDPIEGRAPSEARPAVFFITGDHLGDPDRHADVLDILDVARLVKHLAWGEPVPFADRFDADRDGRLTERDLGVVVGFLLSGLEPAGIAPSALVASVTHDDTLAVLRFIDGSTLTVPKTWSGRFTDLDGTWKLAQALYTRSRPLADLAREADLDHPSPVDSCAGIEADVNRVFYRDDPHTMHRYYALALDNIRRDPVSFAAASLYRLYRVFVVGIGVDVFTTSQFSGSSIAYALANAASFVYFVLFLAGVAVSAYRRSMPAWLLIPALYVPVTICPVLTNMRYSLTIQPFVLAFAAIAMLHTSDLASRLGRPSAAST